MSEIVQQNIGYFKKGQDRFKNFALEFIKVIT